MVEEITIKELLEKAGVDADEERYQELASYIATHGVYAVDLTDDDSEANTVRTHIIPIPNANQTQAKRNQTQIICKSEGEKRNDQNQNLPDFGFLRRCPGVIQRSHRRNESLSAGVDLHFEGGKWRASLRSTRPRRLLHNV